MTHMPDYRTIPPLTEGSCLYTVTGKCCVFICVDGVLVPACPPEWCCPPRYGRMKATPGFWDDIWGTEGQ